MFPQKKDLNEPLLMEPPISPNQPIQELKNPKTCQICYDDVEAGEMLNLACKHQFCRECFVMHLEVCIAQRKVNQLICP
jgi:hypothetical protein